MSTKLLDSEVFEKLGNHLKFTAQYSDFCKLVEVTDDWYPNIDKNKVFVGCWTTPTFPEYPSVYRCLACGNDASGDFRKCGQTGIEANGNGALMRMLPIAFLECSDADVDVVSSLTHAHEISMTGCRGFVSSTRELLRSGILKTDGFSGDYQRITHIEELGVSDIRSSGFVVDTLEAAFWCVKTTNNYRDCVLKAVNLGGDTDTIAAIAGGIAGIMYEVGGERGIPEEWISCILKRDWIEELCDSFQKFCFL